MKVSELLESRRRNWQELERFCARLHGRSEIGRLFGRGRTRSGGLTPSEVSRFAALYRSACADLAMADAYQLPPNTVQYLHRLVGRAHNQLYRSREFRWDRWGKMLLHDVPQQIFHDRCVQLMFVLFWSAFILSAIFCYSKSMFPGFAEELLASEQIDQMEAMFSEPIEGRDPNANISMAAFYINHNTSIGLQCFVSGLLVVPGLFTTLFNAAHLGGSFGYMARPDVEQGENFFEFVTAHGPFELTAIVLAAGAGLRLGWSLISTQGFTRDSSLRQTANKALPIMGASMLMFFMAALIEGFISPSAAPYWIKASIAVLSSLMLMFYFVVLGFPQGGNMLVEAPRTADDIFAED